ncbi:MAG: glycoside hydrolase family 9 protein [Opitutaceae bacterium]|nr:glycoside hydrolase family 9 protein [Cytophagales bacterium]
MKRLALSIITSCTLASTTAQQVSENIKINQVGFYPDGPKLAIATNSSAKKFYLLGESKKDTAFKGTLIPTGTWEYSGETTSKADFSSFVKAGKYVLFVPGLGNSYPFEIAPKINENLGKAALKTFYYQRVSVELLPEYAGKFARKAGHPDNEVLIHGSAQSVKRPEGTKISSPGGWYDAGDYNKYIVNSGISTYTLLAAYEHYPAYFNSLKLNIPESKNEVPDILDESLVNVRWMLTMQDEDGGVYHKLTNANFDAFVMPDKAVSPRYVVVKTTAATNDFAAVMAQSARIFKKFSKQLPGLSDSCLKAAEKAYNWAKKNPGITYEQDQISKSFAPAIVTGAYDDKNLTDEAQWAASELFVTTGKPEYFSEANLKSTIGKFGVPGWQSVNTLALFSIVSNKTSAAIADIKSLETELLAIADKYKNYALKKSEYGIPMGQSKDDFVWGSNSTDANEGIILLMAYDLTKNKEYLNAAIAALDYLLGRNGTGYSYVTGFGGKPSIHPHHRPSEADGITEPIPGFLVGGPNPGVQDQSNCPDAKYPSTKPALAYLDHVCSYASNEIAINWNAPLVYLALGIEAIKAGQK